MQIKQILKTWKNVFSNFKYVIITVLVAVVFYSINVLISGWQNLSSVYANLGALGSIKFFFDLWIGFKSTIILHSFISLIIISILFGMLISLIFYKTKFNISGTQKAGIFGSIGLFIGALVPGCIACGVGLASLLGIGAGALAFLPYEGLELSVFSIALLSFAIVKISNDMNKCNVPLLLSEKDIKLKGGQIING